MFQSRLSTWRWGATATLLLGLAPLGGCSVINAYEDPLIVGDWKRELPAGETNDEMSIDVDGRGNGTLFFTVGTDPTTYEGDFDIKWKHRSPDEFELDWECDSNTCTGLDFTLRCDINTRGSELECEDRSGVWLPAAGDERAKFDWGDD